MNRGDRYSTILDPDILAQASATIIGVGAIGRQIAIQLSSMGVGRLLLIDHDRVNEDNLGTQGWTVLDIGKPKVEALADYLKVVNPEGVVDVQARKFKRSEDSDFPVIFACVDSMAIRKLIFEATAKQGHTEFFADGRMAAEAFRAFAVTPKNGGIEYYAGTLYGDNEAAQGPCTARTTIYCSNIIAGCMVTLYSQFLRGWQLPKEVEMTVAGFAMEAIY